MDGHIWVVRVLVPMPDSLETLPQRGANHSKQTTSTRHELEFMGCHIVLKTPTVSYCDLNPRLRVTVGIHQRVRSAALDCIEAFRL